jgi:CheY-like chemotaxis protein
MLRTGKAIGPIMCKILLVDDDAALRAALEAALVINGHQVFSAQDGLAALRAAVEARPDVIISDVNMPHLEGPEAVRILKALPAFTGIPVILMSGAEPPSSGLAHVELRKPVVAGQLVALVDKVTRSRPPPLPAAAPARRTAARSAEWNRTLAAASLGAPPHHECALRICRGIELMRNQAALIDRLRRVSLDLDESERLFDRIVDSVASLVQLLSAQESMRGVWGK